MEQLKLDDRDFKNLNASTAMRQEGVFLFLNPETTILERVANIANALEFFPNTNKKEKEFRVCNQGYFYNLNIPLINIIEKSPEKIQTVFIN